MNQTLLDILRLLVEAVPSLARILAAGLAAADADDPLVPQLREILPARGHSAAAVDELRRRKT